MATQGQSVRLKKGFLDAFRLTGNVTQACSASGVGRSTVYRWQEHDEQFALSFRQAELESTELLEAEAQRRAVSGSDTLLIFLLKARAPEKYRERHDITSGGQPLQTAHDSLDDAIERRLAQLVVGSQSQTPVEASG